MRALFAVYNADVHGSRQVPTQAIAKSIQDADDNVFNVEPITGPVQTVVNTTRYIGIGQFDIIKSTYLQPLVTFNTVVTDIANVRSSKRYGLILIDDRA